MAQDELVRFVVPALFFFANTALADEVPLVVGRLPTRESHAQIVRAACALRIPGVDVAVDGRRCTFGFAEPDAVPLTITDRDGVVVFEGRLDPELVRSARTNVELHLMLADDYHAGTWVASTWRPRSNALRDLGLVTTVIGGAALVVSSWLALAAYLTVHPLLCFHLFDPNPSSCVGDPTDLNIATAVTLGAGLAMMTLGGIAFSAGRTKVALVPNAVRVTF